MSNSPKIVIAADQSLFTPSSMELLESVGNVEWASEKTDDKLGIRVQGAIAVIAESNRITARVMDAGKGTLKGIVAYGVGYDHIDVTAATERGIYVANCRGSNAETVAELAIALMLNVSRGACYGDRFVREGRWRSTETRKLPSLLIGKEIARKTLGLVGMGAIGRRVAHIAKGFEMRVLVFDPYLSSETITQAGAEPTDLSSLMREADYVSIHVPLSEETRGLISEKEISLMKPTAYLICTARGNVVDEKALIRALRQKKIAGAGLDVFSIEPLPRSSPITKLNNVVLTPHIGGTTKEAIAEMARMTAEETIRIVQGEVPINLVNRTQLATKGVRVQRAPQ